MQILISAIYFIYRKKEKKISSRSPMPWFMSFFFSRHSVESSFCSLLPILKLSVGARRITLVSFFVRFYASIQLFHNFHYIFLYSSTWFYWFLLFGCYCCWASTFLFFFSLHFSFSSEQSEVCSFSFSLHTYELDLNIYLTFSFSAQKEGMLLVQ